MPLVSDREMNVPVVPIQPEHTRSIPQILHLYLLLTEFGVFGGASYPKKHQVQDLSIPRHQTDVSLM